MAKKRGAPKKAETVAKAEVVQIRLNASEKDGFAAAASHAGISMSSWMRERLRVSAAEELRKMGKDVPFLS